MQDRLIMVLHAAQTALQSVNFRIDPYLGILWHVPHLGGGGCQECIKGCATFPEEPLPGGHGSQRLDWGPMGGVLVQLLLVIDIIGQDTNVLCKTGMVRWE